MTQFPGDIDPIKAREEQLLGEKVVELAHLRQTLNTLGRMMIVDDINQQVVIPYRALYSTPQTHKLLQELRVAKAEGKPLSKE